MKFDLFLTVSIFAFGPLALSVYASPQPQSAVPSGRCGRDFGLATCERFAGEFCCSQFGFCGGTADHCNAQTCQFGCDNRDPFRPGTVNPKKAPTPTPTPTPQGRCGRDFGFAACDSSPGEVCCSEFGLHVPISPIERG
ncbi:hypothetical protein BKA69DRAFT_813558 [Paraphysoderma sedebokerense]|nr:hypothetical protein BKA69DRAFT_813558 [Paraphysoderma sedebokerense]